MKEQREVVATVNPEMPQFYDKLDGLEFVKQKDGQIRTNGLLMIGPDAEVRRVLVPEPDAMWGYDSEEYQRYKADPEKWEMAHTIKQLQSELAKLQSDHEALRTDHESLKVSLKRPEAGTSQQSPVTDNEVAAETATTTDEPETDVATDAYIPEPEDQPATVITEVPAEPARAETDVRSWWQRTRDRVMGPIYGNHARVATITRRKSYQYDDRGRVIVEEEVNDEGQRRTGLMAGVTALVGAGVGLGLGYLIWHKTGHDVNNYYDFNINAKPDSVPGSTNVIPGSPGTGSGGSSMNHAFEQTGRHVDYFEGARSADIGFSVSGVELPNGVKLGGEPGHWYLYRTSNGERLVEMGVDGVTSIEDRQGNLSVRAREILVEKGFDLFQVPNGKRYMTSVYG